MSIQALMLHTLLRWLTGEDTCFYRCLTGLHYV